jgi:hypothetical protein
MPDRYGDMADRDDSGNAHMATPAVDRCTLCDADGYRPNLAICDHVDRTAIAKRGIAACRAALAKGTTA